MRRILFLLALGAAVSQAAEIQGVIADWNCVKSMVRNGREKALVQDRRCSLAKNFKRDAYGLITVDKKFSLHQALAIRGEKILRVGSNEEVLKTKGPHTQILDLGGKTVLPGLIDSHVHPTNACMEEFDHPIPVMETIADVLAYIKGRAKALAKDEWIEVRQVFITRLREQRYPTRQELDERTRRVEVLLDGMLAHSRRLLWEQEPGFRACLPEARDPLLVTRNLDTSALAATLPFVGPSLAMDTGMLVGVARVGQTPVLIDPFDRSLDNANLAVVAPAGAGKSFYCKLLAMRQLTSGTDCIVIDPEGEYRALAEAVGGQVVHLAASSPHRLNPFDLPPPPGAPPNRGNGVAEEEDPLAERVTALLGLLEVMLCRDSGTNGGSGALTNLERAVLDRAIYQTYARVGITTDPATHVRPAPLLRDLHMVLADTPGELAGSLAVRLERYVEGSLSAGLFAGPTNVALDRRLVVFNLQRLEDELRPLAIHLIAGFVWTRVRRDRRPRLLFIDEAWSLLRFPEGGAFVAAMARRARKYYLGLVTITQQVGDLADGGNGETILTNAAQVLLLKQKAETIDAATARFRLTPDERQVLLGADKGEGLLLVRGNRIPLQVVASKAEYRLATTNPRDPEESSAAATTTIASGSGATSSTTIRAGCARSSM